MPADEILIQSAAIPFNGTLNRQQFLLLQQIMLPWWGTMTVTTAATLAVACVFAIVEYKVNGAPLLDSLSAFAWAAVLLLYVWALTAYARRRQWRNIQAAQQEIAGSIGNDSLQWNTQLSKSTLPWPQAKQIRQHPQMLLVYYSDTCAFYWPKDFFDTELAWNEANAIAARCSGFTR